MHITTKINFLQAALECSQRHEMSLAAFKCIQVGGNEFQILITRSEKTFLRMLLEQ